jgi:hypothetical protein
VRRLTVHVQRVPCLTGHFQHPRRDLLDRHVAVSAADARQEAALAAHQPRGRGDPHFQYPSRRLFVPLDGRTQVEHIDDLAGDALNLVIAGVPSDDGPVVADPDEHRAAATVRERRNIFQRLLRPALLELNLFVFTRWMSRHDSVPRSGCKCPYTAIIRSLQRFGTKGNNLRRTSPPRRVSPSAVELRRGHSTMRRGRCRRRR